MNLQNEECMICCEKYNKQLKSKVSCNNPSCEFSACKSCIRHYLINSTEDIHCMSCRKAWDNTFVILNLNRSWFKDTYIPHHVDLLFERNKGRIQEVMPEVQNIMEQRRRFKMIEPKIKILNEIRKELCNQKRILSDQFNINLQKLKNDKNINEENFHSSIKKMREEYRNKESEISIEIKKVNDEKLQLQHSARLNNENISSKIKKKQKFIMPCQREDCKGFLNENYLCGMCHQQCCKKCFEMLGDNEDEIKQHSCKKEQVETAELIKSTTKPCPKCGQRIYKISGCDQMWCIECKCPFSWKTGEIVNGVIHNPHYFQYLRENTNGEIPRQPGDNPCDNNNTWRLMRKLHDLCSKLYNDHEVSLSEEEKRKIMEICDIITSFHQIVNHIEYGVLPNVRARIQHCNDYRSDLISWLVKNITEDHYKELLKVKHKNRSKEVDKGYISEMFVNVGKDILNKLLLKLEENDNITNVNISNFEIIINETEKEIMNFIKYYNEENKIISVSHTCRTSVYLKRETTIYNRMTRAYYKSCVLREDTNQTKIGEIKGKNI